MAINYGALVLDTTVTEATNNEIKAKQAAAKKKPEVEYIVDGISGCDMVVTKKSTRKEEQFVMLVSQGQMYIKDIKTGIVTMCDPDNINVFFDKLSAPLVCQDSEGHKLNWTDKFYRGMKFARVLEKIVSMKNLQDYMKKGMFWQDFKEYKEDDIYNGAISYNFKIMSLIYSVTPENLKPIFLEMLSSKLITSYYHHTNRYVQGDEQTRTKISSLLNYFQGKNEDNELFYQKYGVSGVRRIIEEYFQTAVEKFPRDYSIQRILKGESSYSCNRATFPAQYDLSSLIHYLFYSSVEQGYATEIDNYIDLWSDTLAMQVTIFKHGIEDKYPENLASYHQILSYKYSLLKQKIDEEMWKDQAARMAQYERHGKKYSIIAPKTPNDMLNEARMQSNCLSSYVQQVINGRCMIFFLRHSDNIEQSLVTIEVCQDGGLGQVKAKYNRNPSPEESEYVRKWHEDKFIKGQLTDDEEQE